MPHSCTDTGRLAATRGDDDDDDHDHGGGSSVKAPSVDSGTKKDRLNPPTEYKVLDLNETGAALETKLNELGEDGWALVSASPQFIFRRLKKTEEEKKKARVGFGIS